MERGRFEWPLSAGSIGALPVIAISCITNGRNASVTATKRRSLLTSISHPACRERRGNAESTLCLNRRRALSALRLCRPETSRSPSVGRCRRRSGCGVARRQDNVGRGWALPGGTARRGTDTTPPASPPNRSPVHLAVTRVGARSGAPAERAGLRPTPARQRAQELRDGRDARRLGRYDARRRSNPGNTGPRLRDRPDVVRRLSWTPGILGATNAATRTGVHHDACTG